jgi:hypothetical protein
MVWGEQNVVCLSAADVDRFTLTPEARRILTEVGLPKEAEPLFERTDPQSVLGPGTLEHCRIGSDGGYDIIVDGSSGEILTVSSDGLHPERFMNSGLEFFLGFLCRVTVQRRTPPGPSEKLGPLQEELRRLDPEAFEDPDYWWAVVFEQMWPGSCKPVE